MTRLSSASVFSSTVSDACDAYLEARQKRIDKRIEKLVQEEMSKTFFRAKDRQTALERNAEAIKWIKFEGSYWASKVQALKALTTVATTTINLTTEDAALLKGYWK